MTINFIYITFPNFEEASKIGRILIDENIVACVNILPDITSIYKWEGKTEQSSEIILIAKTTSNKFEQLEKRVTELHSYDTPCICALPIDRVNNDFTDWIKLQTN